MENINSLVNQQNDEFDYIAVLLEYTNLMIDLYGHERGIWTGNLIKGKEKTGRYHPVISKTIDSGRVIRFYIYWRDYTNKVKARALAKKSGQKDIPLTVKHGEHVKIGKGRYSRKCFVNAAEWELYLIQKYEVEFKKVRNILKEYNLRCEVSTAVLEMEKDLVDPYDESFLEEWAR